MILDEVAQFLEDEGIGVVGTDIFKAYHPDTAPDTCTVIKEYGGESPAEYFGDDDIPALERPSIQVTCRAKNYADARNLAQLVWAALTKVGNETLSGVEYKRIRAIQTPFPMGQDENSRSQVVCNYSCWKEPS